MILLLKLENQNKKELNLIIIINLLSSFNEYKFKEIFYLYRKNMRMEYLDFL
jgi:hypothetical protein